jgi:hypothetical protein
MARRDRWFVALATVAAVAVTCAFALTLHQRATPKGCSTEIVAGFMGGVTQLRCEKP